MIDNLYRSTALGVLRVAVSNGEGAARVGSVGAGVVLDVTGAAEGGSAVQEVIGACDYETTTTSCDSGRGTTDWERSELGSFVGK